jgi:Zn-dependent peptidase ImmA (M78 family)
MEAGERLAAEFHLGDVPAERLAQVMERELGILVLMVDAKGFGGISGAACRLPELDVVLINRNEPAARRHFDLAHELFHILTWDAMPPEYAEEAREVGGTRVEQLANNFAGAVLMPRDLLAKHGEWTGVSDEELTAKLKAVSAELQVSVSGLKWRLVALGKLKPARARSMADAALRQSRRKDEAKPPLLSRPFMEVLGLAIDQGRVSVRRAADLLDLTVEDLSELFTAHGAEPPADL